MKPLGHVVEISNGGSPIAEYPLGSDTLLFGKYADLIDMHALFREITVLMSDLHPGPNRATLRSKAMQELLPNLLLGNLVWDILQ